MSGINYDLNRIKAFVFDVDGVLSPSTVPMSDKDGQPIRMVNTKDGYAIQLACKLGYKIAIITGAKTESIIQRYNSLGVKDVYIKASRKIHVLNKWIDTNNLNPDEILYMGDDIPDIECILRIGLPCCPSDACEELKKHSKYISTFKGGYGCVRDVIEQTLRAHGDWMKDEHAFGW